MSDVTAGIVAHDDRRLEAGKLYDTLSDEFPTSVFLDKGQLGCDFNHLRAWDAVASEADTPWCAMFEDDALPVPEIGYHLGQALFYAPAPIVMLYLGRGRPVHWQRRIGNAMQFPRPYIVATHVLNTVAVCIRTELVFGLLDDARNAIDDANKPIDEALTEAVRKRALPVAYVNPSLVEHADGPSLAAHQYLGPVSEPRVAWQVGVPDSWVGQFSIM